MRRDWQATERECELGIPGEQGSPGAFFGYYLQGHEDYADYILEDFVSQVDDLAWGMYNK